MSGLGRSLGDRMKRYEEVTHYHLSPRLPLIIRVDGKAFHTLTKGLERPFSLAFAQAMWEGAKAFCEGASGCKLAFQQSDEISFLLTDWERESTQPWFDYDLQKLVSVGASTVGAAFNGAFGSKAAFDARAFSLPEREVVNYFIWRQQDATRNSVSMVAQAEFSHDELMNKSGPQMQDMLMARGINWNDTPTVFKRGATIWRETYEVASIREEFGVQMDGPVLRHRWVVDMEVPIFTADRNYIERWLAPEGA